MMRFVASLRLADEAETQRLGEDLALALTAGDCLALHGDLGAGKSTLARAFIRARARDALLEVPSPTFTLVQSYDLAVPISHFDFYRLGDPGEAEELGVEDSLETGIALIEWPDMAPDMLPSTTIHLRLTEDGSGRRAEIEADGAAASRIARSLSGRDFLDQIGAPGARRQFLTGDASARSYQTIEMDAAPRRILMDWPRQPEGPVIEDGLPYTALAHIATRLLPFRAVSEALLDLGFVAPRVLAADEQQGFALLDDLGADTILSPQGRPIPDRYLAAAECLAALHERPFANPIPLTDGRHYTVPDFDRRAMKIETRLLLDWYWPEQRGRPAGDEERQTFSAIWDALIDAIEDGEKHLLIRDFHNPNILWQPRESGIRRIGIIDFQDAMIGPTAYDLGSLIHDARVDVDPSLRAEMLAAYLESRGGSFDSERFARDLAVMTAQRATKLIGLWVRLKNRDGKPSYMQHMARSKATLSASLAHPVLAPLREWCVKSAIL